MRPTAYVAAVMYGIGSLVYLLDGIESVVDAGSATTVIGGVNVPQYVPIVIARLLAIGAMVGLGALVLIDRRPLRIAVSVAGGIVVAILAYDLFSGFDVFEFAL